MTRGLLGSGAGGFTLKFNKLEYQKAYYQKNKKRIAERKKADYAKNPEKYRKLRREAWLTKKEIQADYLNSIRAKD